jgi:hypothetical protein
VMPARLRQSTAASCSHPYGLVHDGYPYKLDRIFLLYCRLLPRQ